MLLHNRKNKKLSSDPLFKVQQAHLLQHINKFKNSTGLPGFTRATPVQAKAQCYDFPSLHFHLTRVQQTNMFILLDRRAKQKSIEKKKFKMERLCFDFPLSRPKNKRLERGERWRGGRYIVWSWFHRVVEWNRSQ